MISILGFFGLARSTTSLLTSFSEQGYVTRLMYKSEQIRYHFFSYSSFFDSSSEDEDDDDEPLLLDWFIDCPIFIAALRVSSIALRTFSASLGCRSLSLSSCKCDKAFSICSITSAEILLRNYSNCLFVVSQTLCASFFKSTISLLFLSSYLYFSACLSMFYISALERPPED